MNVFIIAAMSADGFIARAEHDSSLNWTSQDDFRFFQQRTKEAGVVIMGSTTFSTVKRALVDRMTYVMTRSKTYDQFGSTVRPTNLQPAELLKDLEKKGVAEVAICGGSSIYSQFMKENLVNEIYLTIEPVIFGSGISFFNQELTNKIELKEVLPLSDQTLVLHYQVI